MHCKNYYVSALSNPPHNMENAQDHYLPSWNLKPDLTGCAPCKKCCVSLMLLCLLTRQCQKSCIRWKKNSGFHAVCLHFPELWIFYARLECIILLYHTGNNVDHVVWLTLALFARDKGDKHTIQKKSVDTSSIWHVQAMKSSGMWWRYR